MMEDGINELLRNQFESFTFDTSVRKFIEGSVIVLFDIDVTSKLETDDILDKTDIANALKNNINQEYGFLFGKFSAPNNSVIIQGSQAEDIDDQETEKNMQSVATMRTTEAPTQSSRPTSKILDDKSTARPQISEDWENMRNMEISAKAKIDSIKEDEDMEMDTDTESTFQQELSETATESIEPVTDLSYEFISLELESELGSGSGEVEDATNRVETLILY